MNNLSLIHQAAEVQRTPDAAKQDCIDRWNHAEGKEAEQRAYKLAAIFDYLDIDAPSQRPPRTDFEAWKAWCALHKGVFEAACAAFGVMPAGVHVVYKMVTGYKAPPAEKPVRPTATAGNDLPSRLRRILMEQGEKALADYVIKGCK
jgi:hypothetical protein